VIRTKRERQHKPSASHKSDSTTLRLHPSAAFKHLRCYIIPIDQPIKNHVLPDRPPKTISTHSPKHRRTFTFISFQEATTPSHLLHKRFLQKRHQFPQQHHQPSQPQRCSSHPPKTPTKAMSRHWSLTRHLRRLSYQLHPNTGHGTFWHCTRMQTSCLHAWSSDLRRQVHRKIQDITSRSSAT